MATSAAARASHGERRVSGGCVRASAHSCSNVVMTRSWSSGGGSRSCAALANHSTPSESPAMSVRQPAQPRR